MTLRWFGWALALAAIGCAADAEQTRGAAGMRGDDLGAAGMGGNDFGNASGFIPPPPTGAVITGGKCKAGHYLGQLEGMYDSSLAFGMTPGGIPVSTDPKLISTELLNTLFPPANGVSPGFEFWLNASDDVAPCDAGEEFCFDYQVEGGKAAGVANGLFPFEMEINGQLDCDQGKFDGLIQNGWYEVAGLRFAFEGTISGSYDAQQSAFFDGVWEVVEPAAPPAGGMGTWYTAYIEP